MEHEVYVNSEEALHLVEKELRIPRSQIAVSGSGGGNYLTCLVHESWLGNLARGVVTDAVTHDRSDYELKLLLQSSHCAPLPPWHRVSIRAILKQPEKAEYATDQPHRNSSQEHHFRGDEQLQTIGELLDHISRKNHEHSLEDAMRQYSHHTVLSTSNHCHHSVLKDAVRQAVRDVARLSVIHLDQGVSNYNVKGVGEKKNDENGCLETNCHLETSSDAVSESLDELLYTDHCWSQTSDNFSENVLPLVCAVESDSAFFFVEPFIQHSLFDLVIFSPAILSGSHVRPLFVIYQLLHAVQCYHRNMLNCGDITLHDVKVYEGLWIFLQRVGVSYLTKCDRQHSTAPHQDTTPVSSVPPTTSTKLFPTKWDPNQYILSLDTASREGELVHLVEQWVSGNISNYDYLMALNHCVGRRTGDPNYHPVFPWVTDFTQQNGGYRDLTKSKFRLNKGDHQLDMTYKGVSRENDSNAVPHHVSDVLSDITYHVYLARRTPKSVLCNHVRTKWEPNEYPSSMQRLYYWTPDECIPEFFSDPTIFQSIHADLPDLELPEWSGSPHEFIAQHQEMLESEHVSRNLNHWIDLTFGYKLASKASIKAKNVCLHLVDKHQFVTNHGVVQLFTKPHPSRSFAAPPLSTRLLSPKMDPHNYLVEDAKTSAHAHHSTPLMRVAVEDTPLSLGVIGDLSIEETDSVIDHVPGEEIEGSESKIQEDISDGMKQQSTAVGEMRTADSMSIILPMDFNPMEYLDKLEALKSFKSQFRFEETKNGEGISKQLSEMESFSIAAQRDLQALGCLIVEMFASDKLRLLSSNLTRDNRVQAISHLCASSPKILPRFVKSGVLALLGQTVPSRGEGQGCGLPPLTPGLLLHPQAGLFPFPGYFEELHSFLGGFYREGLVVSTESEGEGAKNSVPNALPSPLRMEYCFQDREKSGYTMGQVDFAVRKLPSLIPELDEEGLQLLFYHLEPLFKCPVVQLYTYTQLFDLLSQAYGPKVTSRIFMKPLVKLFDSHLMANYEHILTQSFVSQLIVRFGLEQFLSHFINFVVDAVAFKSLGTKYSKPEQRRMSEFGLGRSTENQDAIDLELKASQYDMNQDQTVSPQKVQSGGSLEEPESASPFSVTVDQLPGDELNVRVFPNMLGDDDADRPQRLLADKEDEEEEDRDPWKAWSVEKESEEIDVEIEEEEVNITVRQTVSLEKDQNEKDEVNAKLEEDLHTSPEESACEVEKGNKGEDVSTEMLGEQQLEAQDEADKNQQSESKNEPTFDSSVNPTKEESENLLDPSEEQSNKVVGNEEEPEGEDEDGGSCVSEGDETVQNSEELSIFPEYPNQVSKDTPKGFDSSKDTFTCGSPFQEPTLDLVSTNLKKTREALSPEIVSGLAAECVTWLAPRLGPVLTSRYLASQLLHMLSRCYMGRVGVDSEQEFEGEVEVDDRNARWVLFCLANFCTFYGEAFMIYQYLPFVEKVIKAIHSSVSARNEAAVAGVLALLKYCLPYMSKDSLMEHFDTFSHGVFQPLLRILASSNLKFPGGGSARTALCHSYVDLLTALSQKLERELAREFMTPLVQQFFSCFELVHMKKKVFKLGESSFTAVTSIERRLSTEDKSSTSEGRETTTRSDSTEDGNEVKDPTGPEEMEAFYKTSYYQELCQTFSAAMAHNAFVPLCGIMGSKYIESALYNHDLIWNLCCKYDPHLSHPTMEPGTETDAGDNGNSDTAKQLEPRGEDDFQTQTQETSLVSETTAKGLGDKIKELGGSGGGEDKNKPGTSRIPNKRFRGRKRYRKQSTEKQEIKEKEEKWNSSASDQYLRGTWLEHWQHQLELKGRSRRFNLKEVKLQTFTGHSGSVRAMYMQDSEHYFLSASKDKTVKLWSLSNHGDGTAQSASSWTYYRHTRAVFAVDMVESQRHAASCDGTIHLWDPVSGSCLAVLETPKNNPVVAMTAMPAPSCCVVAAMAESTVRFVDARQGQFAQEWKISTSNVAGSVRDICCSPDGRWVSIGFSTGLVSVLDVRGGLLRSQRRAHTSDILQVKAFSSTSLLTSSVDQGVFLWKDDGLRLRSLKGHTDPLHCMLVFKDHVISASTSNRIGIHIVPDDSSLAEVTYTSYKPRADVFRGNITSLGYLPINHLLLIGSDTGNITLCA